MIDKEYVKVYCCADCAHYDMKKHRCRNGAKDKGTGRKHFYRDCCLGIHNENESVPIDVLQEIKKEIELKEKTLTDKYGQTKYGVWTDDVCNVLDKYIEKYSNTQNCVGNALKMR